MDVRLEDGTVVKNVPEGMTQSELLKRLGKKPEQGILADYKRMGKTALGFGELGTQLLSGIPASAVAGIEGIVRGAVPGGMTGAEAVQNRLEAMTYQPRTEVGQGLSEGVNKAFGVLEKGADYIGEKSGDPENALGATAVKTAILGAPALLGLRGLGVKPVPKTVRTRVASEAQDAGYVVPPTDVAPTAGKNFVESLGGKPRLRQEAAYRNQEVTNNLAAKELGLPEGTEVTRGALDAVRAEAGQAYSVLENSGTIVTDTAFRRALSNATRELKEASKDFPVLARKESPVSEAIVIAQGLNKPTFNASSVSTVTRILRDNASAAFRNGQTRVGRAYRELSEAIENAAEAHLSKFGDPQAVAAFRAARERIAKTYSVEEALAGDGIVSAPKLAAQLKKGVPLTGTLRTIAEFAEQFPKSARAIVEKPIQTGRLLQTLGLGGGAGLLGAGNPLGAGVIAATTFGGPLLRQLMLSKAGQSLAKPSPSTAGIPGALTGMGVSGDLPQ